MNRREFVITMAAVGAAIKAKCSSLGAESAQAKAQTAAPSFPAIEEAPLGGAPDKALVLHKNWQMREEALCGDHGATFSQPGFDGAQGWHATTVPTTKPAAQSEPLPDPDFPIAIDGIRPDRPKPNNP